VLFNIEERTGLQEKESSKDLTSKVEPSGQTGEVTGPSSRIGSAHNTGSLRTRGQRQWDASTFFAELSRRRGDEEARVAWKILDWAAQRKLRIWWGKGLQDGSFFPMLDHDNGVYWTVAIWTYGRVEIQYQWMLTTPAFASEATRLELLERFNHLPGVSLSPIVITKRPAFPLAILKDEAALGLFLQTLDWIVQVVRVGAHEGAS
jgi:hypothetical protein